MARRSFLALLSFLALAGMVGAAPAAAPKPLRTLVYAIAYATRARNEELTSGFTGAVNMGNARGGQRLPAAATAGDATVDRQADVSDDGTLTINVIAATGDGGLVVDAAFAGKTTTQPTIRVAIFADGRLSYDPRDTLSAQAGRVLPLLARGIIANRDVSPGSSWSTAVPFAQARGSTLYRVVHVDGERAELAIERQMTVEGPRGFSEQDHGTATYATDRLCPLAFELDAYARHQPAPDQYVTESAHLSAKLISDTFSKTAP
ncbi:MAG TPA: hypothetical protein VMA36_15585 [Candidatus Limnocylindria bacterium]|jgi:hypothetical protein|nr:hypothetical protein [Candidatus Limnocylindria bacterium]